MLIKISTMEYEKMFPPQCGMSGEPLDSCGIQWSRETPQEPSPGDEEAHGPPRGKQVDRSSWNYTTKVIFRVDL